MSILAELIKQAALVIFYLALIILSVKLGMGYAKKKNAKKNSEDKSE